MSKLAHLSALLCLSLSFGIGSASASTALDEACALYDKHQFGPALKKLDSLPESQRGARSEYYRALSLQALQRFPEAKLAFQKVASQRKDARLSQLSQQGLVGLARMEKNRSTRAISVSSSVRSGSPVSTASSTSNFVTDSKWKLAQPGEGGEGTNFHGMPADWTFVKTREGCGRH